MDINELEAFKMSDAVKFHNKLNPNLWIGTELDPEVREQLLLIAEDFVTTLGIKDLDIVDITISGSNAAYSYTPHSDLDLHVLVDMSKLRDDEIYRELFTAKKTLYNDSHNITVHGVPVELYVQDVNEPVKSLGEYSVLNDKWIRIPKKTKANFDQAATKAKFDNLAEIVELALKTKNLGRVEKTIDTIKRYRKAGLSKGGEFGPENLAFKALRKQGGIQDLYDLRDVLRSEKLSIEEYANEDYDPNGPPPGPEFKPTMPAGTVRVDVSDVYDWYKLGQHISNLKGLGKHDFGKGPPSTIMAFGNEPEEHKYIQDLEKTGLTTTDIDPVDKNQPKGMKRQKTDPTFNVNEAPIKLYTDPNYFGAEVGDYKASGPVVDIPANKLVGFEPDDKMNQPKSKANVKKIVSGLENGDKLPPILVRKYKNGYQVVDGHHRFWAYKLLGIKSIPAQIVPDEDIETVNETADRTAAVLKIQKYLNKKYGANLDLDGKLGPLTLKSINKFMPRAKKGLADEPNKTTAVQGNKLKESSGAKIDAHREGDTIWINYFEVPVKGKGLGRAEYEKFEKSLPKDIKKIRLVASDAGYGPTHDFWDRMGFDYAYPDDDNEMVKLLEAPRTFQSQVTPLEKLIQDYGYFISTGTVHLEKNGETPEAQQKLLALVQRLQKDAKTFVGLDKTKMEANRDTILSHIHQMMQYAIPILKQYLPAEKWEAKRGQINSVLTAYNNARQINEASGYIPSEKEKNDPRFLMALTKDVRPDANKKNAKAFGWKVSRAGIPPQARADGKITESLMNQWKSFLMEGSVPKIGYHVTATEKLPIILKHGIKADRRGNSYVWDSLEMAQWFKDFQNDEDQDRTIVKVDMSDLDAHPDPETDDMSEWSSRFEPGTKGGAWIVSGPIPSDKIIG